MKYLVTGGTGFIGLNIVLRLINECHDVTITGHDAEQKIPNFRGKILQPSFLGIDWDEIEYFDAVFHQAAINDTTLQDRKELFRSNVESSEKLFRNVIRQGCKKIVYASSTAIYGNSPAPYKEGITPFDPLNPYAESKIALEQMVSRLETEYPDVLFVGLRYCNVYGPRENHKGKRATMIYQLAQQIKKGNPTLFKWGEQKRDYIYVQDVVDANILALDAQQNCVVNCGSGISTSFNDLVSILSKIMNVQRETQFTNNPYTATYQNHTECDMSLAEKMLKFKPSHDIKTGIQKYYESGFLV